MLHASEPQPLTERFASEIEDLRTIARMHALPMGSANRLQSLPLRLARDSRLRSDLTEQIRSLQQQDPDLGLSDVLSLLLIAIGGSPSLETRRDMEEVVDLTGGFLASLGGWPGSDVEPLIDIDHPPDHDPRLDLAAAATSSGPEAVAAAQPGPQDQAAEPAEEPAPASLAAGAVTLAEITNALARLERGNLELRLHLDSIDQRICRMEPLLEAAPSAAPVDEAAVPTPVAPSLPVRAPEAIEPAPVVAPVAAPAVAPVAAAIPAAPRSTVVSEYEIQRQRADEIKAQRRISLTSNFVNAEPEMPRVRAGESMPQRQGAAVLAENVLPEVRSVANAVLPARTLGPRRDRFAAAREIPGTAADSDPLYTATDEELAQAQRGVVAPHVEVSPEQRGLPEEAPAVAIPPAKIPAPDEVYRQPEAPARDEAAPAKRLHYLDLEPVTKPEDARTEPRFESLPALEEPARRRPGVWVGSVAAVALLGAAGFLYVNGLPAMVTGWVSGSSPASASIADQGGPSTGSEPTDSSASRAPTASSRPATRLPSSVGGVVAAHDSSSANTSVDKTSGPTFVPGGVMDGYLVSAPRPQYPQLAGLANVQGKISLEAMISKTGDVEALKVLGGPQLLRNAALDAVKQWQYRPFEVKGKPVEVRTIIRVDVASRSSTPADQ